MPTAHCVLRSRGPLDECFVQLGNVGLTIGFAEVQVGITQLVEPDIYRGTILHSWINIIPEAIHTLPTPRLTCAKCPAGGIWLFTRHAGELSIIRRFVSALRCPRVRWRFVLVLLPPLGNNCSKLLLKSLMVKAFPNFTQEEKNTFLEQQDANKSKFRKPDPFPWVSGGFLERFGSLERMEMEGSTRTKHLAVDHKSSQSNPAIPGAMGLPHCSKTPLELHRTNLQLWPNNSTPSLLTVDSLWCPLIKTHPKKKLAILVEPQTPLVSTCNKTSTFPNIVDFLRFPRFHVEYTTENEHA